MNTPRMPLERVREEFHKRSWDSMLPGPSDPDSVRSGKRDRLIKLLEIKEIELLSLKVSRGDKARAEGAIAEVAETPPVQARGLGRLADAEQTGLNTSCDRRKSNISSLGPREREQERERRRRHLPQVGGSLGGSTAKPDRRTHPRAQAIVNDANTPIVRQRTGRDSLSRAFLPRRSGGLDTPIGANTPGDTLGTMYTNGTPGVYIPSMRERMIDVTGTELAEDMAGNLVAGIFAASDPCSVADSHGNGGGQESVEDEANPPENMLESQIENHNDERLRDRSSEQLYRIPYGNDDEGNPVSFLMRFPEHCMYGRVSRSGNHVAVLLGSLIDKEPKEIVVLSVEDDIRVSLVVGVQRSRRYFPAAIPFNVNFFDLAETARGDPVLLVSCAFDLTDVETQEAGDEGDTKLHVLVRGKEAVAVESEQPIIFVDASGDRNEVVVTGAYADQGARVMKFDPLWQSFAWKKDYEFHPPEGHGENIVTHISKILVFDDAGGTGSMGKNGLLPGKCSRPPSIKAVLASDFTSEDIVCSFGEDASDLDRIENAEVFMDGDSWRWFLVHRKAIAQLGFAGGPVGGPTSGAGSEEIRGEKKPRVLTAIFASDSYVAAGDINGKVTVWDVRDLTRVACKRFSIAVFEETKITSIVRVRAKDQDALIVMGSSGGCLLISLPELFV